MLIPQITAATGWSTTATTAAFSGGLLVSALTGIPVGRIRDRRGPRAVMTTGSLLGVVAVLAIAYAPNLAVFTAAWLLAGVAMASTFYQPTFAALTCWWGSGRIRALTVVTLAGGLASTAFAPLAATLAEHLSWRTTYAALAVLLAGAWALALGQFGSLDQLLDCGAAGSAGPLARLLVVSPAGHERDFRRLAGFPCLDEVVGPGA